MDESKIIEKSAEHAFLYMLDRIRQDPTGWFGIRIAFSRKLKHENIVTSLTNIENELQKVAKRSHDACKYICEHVGSISPANLYKFRDGDVVLLATVSLEKDLKDIKALHQNLQERFGTELCEFHSLVKDIYSYQRLSDNKLLSCKRISAYEKMADRSMVKSIPLRRSKRDDPLIIFVEDDKFTSTHACNILNKEFDVIPAKTGEEAILYYIEHAPDMVFLDIHLPGLTGCETLKAIKKVDARAHVVMLSVDTVKKNILETSHSGAAGFIKKPFSKSRLINTASKSPFIKIEGNRTHSSDFLS